MAWMLLCPPGVGHWGRAAYMPNVGRHLCTSETEADKIGRIASTGSITEFTVPTASSKPTAITTGPDGNLRLTESAVNAIGRLTPSGTFTHWLEDPDDGYERI